MAETTLDIKKEEHKGPAEPFRTPKAYKATSSFPLKPMLIKYDGMMDWNGLYKLIYEWFIDRGYYFEEKMSAHKIPTPMGAEDEFEIDGWKRITSYVKERINLKFHFFEMRDVEVIKDGQKKNMVKTRMLLTILGTIETGADVSERWKESQLNQYIQGLMQNYIVKKELDTIWTDRLYYITIKLQTEIKQFLNLQAKENAYYDVW